MIIWHSEQNVHLLVEIVHLINPQEVVKIAGCPDVEDVHVFLTSWLLVHNPKSACEDVTKHTHTHTLQR